jgi:3-hydroxymyristoyl/3-hydroxydecanoyl-(acyl carrier protein) dehydratase
MAQWATIERAMADRHFYLSVPAEHPVFRGHFPGNPIVPGTLLLEWVQREVAQLLGRAPSALRVRESKFFTPLAPLQRAELSLEIGASRCAFSIQCDAVRIARGILEWGDND